MVRNTQVRARRRYRPCRCAKAWSCKPTPPRCARRGKTLNELMLSDHPHDCLSCTRDQNCEFQKLGEDDPDYGIPLSKGGGAFQEHGLYLQPDRLHAIRQSAFSAAAASPSVKRCRAWGCSMCNAAVSKQWWRPTVGRINSVNCAYCGQCTTVCPVGALTNAMPPKRCGRPCSSGQARDRPNGPAIRVALGEEFAPPARHAGHWPDGHRGAA